MLFSSQNFEIQCFSGKILKYASGVEIFGFKFAADMPFYGCMFLTITALNDFNQDYIEDLDAKVGRPIVRTRSLLLILKQFSQNWPLFFNLF